MERERNQKFSNIIHIFPHENLVFIMIIMCQYMSQDTSVDIWQFQIILDVDIFFFILFSNKTKIVVVTTVQARSQQTNHMH